MINKASRSSSLFMYNIVELIIGKNIFWSISKAPRCRSTIVISFQKKNHFKQRSTIVILSTLLYPSFRNYSCSEIQVGNSDTHVVRTGGLCLFFRLRENFGLGHSHVNVYDHEGTYLATKPKIYMST